MQSLEVCCLIPVFQVYYAACRCCRLREPDGWQQDGVQMPAFFEPGSADVEDVP
jgi:hypothetical protein